jgi:hypothetical protein
MFLSDVHDLDPVEVFQVFVEEIDEQFPVFPRDRGPISRALAERNEGRAGCSLRVNPFSRRT